MIGIASNVPHIWGQTTVENAENSAISNARVTNILHVLRNKVLDMLRPEPRFYKLPRDCILEKQGV